MRGRLLRIVLVLLVPCCRRPLQPHAAEPVVTVAARVVPAGAGVREVIVSAPAGARTVLVPVAGGDFHGSLVVKPGTPSIEVQALGPGGARIGALAGSLAVARSGPAQVLVSVGADKASPPAPVVEWFAAPRSSVVGGERLPLDVRIAFHGAGPVEVAWSTSPAGCGSFEHPSAATTTWTAAAAGTCTLSVTASAAGRRDSRALSIVVRTRGQSYRYPLRGGPGGRYLVDQRGTPFFVKGEAAWLALVNLDETEQETYLADRSAKGFNLVEVMLINHDYTSPPDPFPPANRYGEQPFLRPGDFSTTGDAYFDRAVAFVRRAAAHGMVVLLAPLYLGFDGGHEGWWQELSTPANTRAVCSAFGRYLGRKFKNSENLFWLAGGDYAPPADSEGEARFLEILRGIQAAGASQPWTGHWNFDHLGGISTDEAHFTAAMDVNGIYQYADTYRSTARAYAVPSRRPSFLLESAYEREHAGSRLQPFRKAWWWSMMSGAAGVLWGNNFLWMCETARGPHPATYGDGDGTVSSWAAEMESPGTYEALHLHAFFEGIAWHRLVPSGVPSGGPEVVIGGRGSGADRIVAAATPENDLLVAYVPPNGSRPRRFSLDLSRLRRPARARWYDPSTGAFVPLPGPLPPAQSVGVETPGANGSGVNDWALLVDTPLLQ